jgi:outer membrane biosynthesis protein TonB
MYQNKQGEQPVKVQPKIEVKETGKVEVLPSPKVVQPTAPVMPVVQKKEEASKPVVAVVPKIEPKPQPVASAKKTQPVASAKKEVSQEVKATPKVAKSEEAKEKDRKFFLRIISLPYHEYYSKMATKIADYMHKEKGIELSKARVSNHQKTKYWVVDVGKFDSADTKEAKEFQKKVQDIKYDGTYQFKDAFFISY